MIVLWIVSEIAVVALILNIISMPLSLLKGLVTLISNLVIYCFISLKAYYCWLKTMILIIYQEIYKNNLKNPN